MPRIHIKARPLSTWHKLKVGMEDGVLPQPCHPQDPHSTTARGPFRGGQRRPQLSGPEDGSRREPGRGGGAALRRPGSPREALGTPREGLGTPGIASPSCPRCYEPLGVGNDTEG